MEANSRSFSHKINPKLKIADPPRVESSVFYGGLPVNPGSPRGEGCCSIIGVALIADGLHMHIPRGFIYFAIAFSLGVEALNFFVRTRRTK